MVVPGSMTYEKRVIYNGGPLTVPCLRVSFAGLWHDEFSPEYPQVLRGFCFLWIKKNAAAVTWDRVMRISVVACAHCCLAFPG